MQRVRDASTELSGTFGCNDTNIGNSSRFSQTTPEFVLVCCSKPLVVGSVRIAPHEGIVDAVIAVVDLVVSFQLIVVPDTSAGLGNNGLDGKQVTHLPWLENPALRVNERDALILENEPGAQLPVRKVTMHFAQHFDTFERGKAHLGVEVV